MAFGIFIHRSDSIYEDSPTERYQFPRQYLARARECVNDWIIYYEPRAVPNTRGYFAVARVQEVIPDPKAPGMYIALIEPGSYLDFSTSVPFNSLEGPAEQGLLTESGRFSGRAQWAVRPLSSSDFNRIIKMGIDLEEPLLPRESSDIFGSFVQEERAPFHFEPDRERTALISNRVVRDRIFRRVVLNAYDERCAITSLKLINGGGRAEVQAAHIRPVSANGPDTINNGLALSGTAHWMFDRGLISLTDDLEIMISRQVNDLEGISSIINKSGHALQPRRPLDRPHPQFLKWHRYNCFKA